MKPVVRQTVVSQTGKGSKLPLPLRFPPREQSTRALKSTFGFCLVDCSCCCGETPPPQPHPPRHKLFKPSHPQQQGHLLLVQWFEECTESTGGSRGRPLSPQDIFFKIMQFSGNFKEKRAPILSKFRAQPPPWGQKSTGPPLTKILDPPLESSPTPPPPGAAFALTFIFSCFQE